MIINGLRSKVSLGLRLEPTRGFEDKKQVSEHVVRQQIDQIGHFQVHSRMLSHRLCGIFGTRHLFLCGSRKSRRARAEVLRSIIEYM